MKKKKSKAKKKAKPGSAARPIDVQVEEYCGGITSWKGVQKMAKFFGADWYDVAELVYKQYAPKTPGRTIAFCTSIFDLAKQLNKKAVHCNYLGREFFRVGKSNEEFAIQILGHSPEFQKNWIKISRAKEKKYNRKNVLKFYRKTMKRADVLAQVKLFAKDMLPLTKKQLNYDK